MKNHRKPCRKKKLFWAILAKSEGMDQQKANFRFLCTFKTYIT